MQPNWIKDKTEAQDDIPEVSGGELVPAIVKPQPVRITLMTDPITKRTPITHSSLSGIPISKSSYDPTYNLFTANCSDATGQCLQDITGVDFTSGITTPIGVSRKARKVFGDTEGYREIGGGLFRPRLQSFLIPWYDYRKASDKNNERRLEYELFKRLKGHPDMNVNRFIKWWWENHPKLNYSLDENGNVIHKDGGILKAQSGTKSPYQLIMQESPSTYTDGYGVEREEYEPKWIKVVRNIRQRLSPALNANGERKYVGSSGMLGFLVAPEWEGLEIPEVTSMHRGFQGTPKGISAIETSRFVNLPKTVSEAPKSIGGRSITPKVKTPSKALKQAFKERTGFDFSVASKEMQEREIAAWDKYVANLRARYRKNR